jgi:hypothetical protein
VRIDSSLKADHNVLEASSKSSPMVAIVSDLLGRVDRPKLAGYRLTWSAHDDPQQTFEPT